MLKKAGARCTRQSRRARVCACPTCDSGEDAKLRCTRCRHTRYCGRACQLAHWQAHRGQCDRAPSDWKERREKVTAAHEVAHGLPKPVGGVAYTEEALGGLATQGFASVYEGCAGLAKVLQGGPDGSAAALCEAYVELLKEAVRAYEVGLDPAVGGLREVIAAASPLAELAALDDAEVRKVRDVLEAFVDAWWMHEMATVATYELALLALRTSVEDARVYAVHVGTLSRALGQAAYVLLGARLLREVAGSREEAVEAARGAVEGLAACKRATVRHKLEAAADFGDLVEVTQVELARQAAGAADKALGEGDVRCADAVRCLLHRARLGDVSAESSARDVSSALAACKELADHPELQIECTRMLAEVVLSSQPGEAVATARKAVDAGLTVGVSQAQQLKSLTTLARALAQAKQTDECVSVVQRAHAIAAVLPQEVDVQCLLQELSRACEQVGAVME